MRRVVLLTLLGLLALAAPAAAQNRQATLCESYEFSEEPPAWAAQLPPATETTYSMEDVQIESADGTMISATVYRPDAFEGQRLPTVLVMSPYHALLGYYKEQERLEGTPADCITPFLLQRGYNVVLADMRGTHNTDSCFDYGGKGDQQDGYATVQWIAGQPWSSGNVGMYGVSHVGMSQYSAAVTTPPALKAIIPIAPITSFYRYLYSGGVHYETNMLTPAAYMYLVGAPPPTNVTDPNWASNVADTTCGADAVANGMSLDGTFNDYWRERDYPSQAEKIKTPVFHVHGTLDENVKTDHFGAIWEALERHDVPRKALIGPWAHSEPKIDDWHLHALRWYEHHLRGNDTGMMREPVLTLIDQGNYERYADAFPIDRSATTVLEAGAEKLAPAAPAGEATFRDIPGMRRANLRETPPARVIYTGDELTDPLRLSGTPVFEVVAAIDARDTNFAVQLFDVDPQGVPTYITRGYLDAKLRNGLDRPEPVTPGEALRYRVELHPREWVLPPGHRLQVMLSASDSCQWGTDPACSSTGVVSDTTAATITVTEGPGQTRLIVPTAPVQDVIRKPAATPPVRARAARLRASARRLRKGAIRIRGTAPQGARILVRVRSRGRTAVRRVVARRGRFSVVLPARGRKARVQVRATLPDGRVLRATPRVRRR